MGTGRVSGLHSLCAPLFDDYCSRIGTLFVHLLVLGVPSPTPESAFSKLCKVLVAQLGDQETAVHHFFHLARERGALSDFCSRCVALKVIKCISVT